MKTLRLTKLIGGVTLGVALLASSAAWALPPRQHVVRGVIESIDYSASTLVLVPSKGGKPLVFVWKDFTRFKQGGSRLCRSALQKGAPVAVHYRREMGQLVPREVNLRSDAPTPCASGKCCAQDSKKP